MHAGLHIPACILNQTFSPLGTHINVSLARVAA